MKDKRMKESHPHCFFRWKKNGFTVLREVEQEGGTTLLAKKNLP